MDGPSWKTGGRLDVFPPTGGFFVYFFQFVFEFTYFLFYHLQICTAAFTTVFPGFGATILRAVQRFYEMG